MDELQIKNAVKQAISEMSNNGDIVDYDKIGEIFSETINEELMDFESELADKWINGKIILEPGNLGLQSKEIPVEKFFKKIISIRDKLRVLEQHINSNKKLDEEEKINIQSYITRCYGTLTTFNVLFKFNSDQFKGSGSGSE
ncbi:MAG: hypothetical protein CVT90_01550 [Candidatus Altiarchaeales archaeon HGW-Altiarchaeales-3]|nr:MAG: hypothetical protein CVT90_01550 [Candidatus Altiarchaeales archaeon HGW-Altiarchaeales-3]